MHREFWATSRILNLRLPEAKFQPKARQRFSLTESASRQMQKGDLDP